MPLLPQLSKALASLLATDELPLEFPAALVAAAEIGRMEYSDSITDDRCSAASVMMVLGI